MVEAAKGRQTPHDWTRASFLRRVRFIYQASITGKYGKCLGGHFNRVISDPKWLKNFYSMDGSGGPMLDLHIHDAHFIRTLFGMPKKIQSVARLRGDVPEYFSSQFLYDDTDLVVTANSGCMQQSRPFEFSYEVHFEKATIFTDSTDAVPSCGRLHRSPNSRRR